jgi:hypothetical protein
LVGIPKCYALISKRDCSILNTFVRQRTLPPKGNPRMLTPEQVTQIKAEVERLEKLREDCTDSGIRKRIEAWIDAETKKLKSAGHATS